jgi:D-alanyl-D-alanine dipeptidase
MSEMMRRTAIFVLFAACLVCGLSSFFQPQIAASTTPAPQLHVPPRPADAPGAWKRLIGEYEHEGVLLNVLERAGGLFIGTGSDSFIQLRPVGADDFMAADTSVQFRLNSSGRRELTYGDKTYVQLSFGDDQHSFHIMPLRPPEELRKEALAARPPVQPADVRKPDLVELVTIDPTIHLDIRYATSNNFMGRPFYREARAFLQRPAAEAAVRANRKLRAYGYGLLIHDGYRPWYVTKMFWDATPEDKKKFVADPKKGSNHNRGGAVDLSMYELVTGKPVEMTGTYDEMSDRSYPDYPGGTSLQRWHRDLLRAAMESEGFKVYKVEWWHFDYKDWAAYPVMNIPFDRIPHPPSAVSR